MAENTINQPSPAVQSPAATPVKPKEVTIGGRKYTELPPLESRPKAEAPKETAPALTAQEERAMKVARASELIGKLMEFELVNNGVNQPLSLSSDPAAAATIATTEQVTTIRESLKLLGRYKEPLSAMVLPEKWTPDNSPAALNKLQKEYDVENGNSGYRFGTQTRAALVSELEKFIEQNKEVENQQP